VILRKRRSGVPTTYFEDGIHPTSAGHTRMANILKPIITPYLGLTLPTEYTHGSSYSATAIYSADIGEDIPAGTLQFYITSGTGVNLGVFTVTGQFLALATDDGNRNTFTLNRSMGTHPLTGIHYTRA
jgi:hypothetical protein